jgi:hypothetical protein
MNRRRKAGNTLHVFPQALTAHLTGAGGMTLMISSFGVKVWRVDVTTPAAMVSATDGAKEN